MVEGTRKRGQSGSLPEGYRLEQGTGEVPSGALELLDREFGKGYAWEGFDELYYAGQALADFVIAEDGICVGVCLGRYLTSEEVAIEVDFFGLPQLAGMRMSTVETLAVDSKHRGRRLGSVLVGEMIGRLLEDRRLHLGVPSALMANSWIRPESCSEPLFLRSGFIVRGRYPGFWTERSIQEPFDCPVDRIPCRCVASILVKDIEQPKEPRTRSARGSNSIRIAKRGAPVDLEVPEHPPLRTMMARGFHRSGEI